MCARQRPAPDRLRPLPAHRAAQALGSRGSGRWKPIEWDQLLEEIVEGGKIFADSGDPASADLEILGFRGLYAKREVPMDPKARELGARTNSFVFQGGRIKKSRFDFAKRFTHAFGSVNVFEHPIVCEVPHHAATEAVYPTKHAIKPDVMGTTFLIFWGTLPGDANFPMQALGRMVADARSRGMRDVCVDPVCHCGSVVSEFADWVPIRPGTDGALALAMSRWIIENQRFARAFTSHGRHAACELCRGPVKRSNGFYNGLAIHMLNLLVGNCNGKGGIMLAFAAFLMRVREQASDRREIDRCLHMFVRRHLDRWPETYATLLEDRGGAWLKAVASAVRDAAALLRERVSRERTAA